MKGYLLGMSTLVVILLKHKCNSFFLSSTVRSKSSRSLHQRNALATSADDKDKSSGNTHDDNDTIQYRDFMSCLQEMSLPTKIQKSILHDLQTKIGVTSAQELYSFALELNRQSQELKDTQLTSKVLKDDFGVSPLRCHQLQGALSRLVMKGEGRNGDGDDSTVRDMELKLNSDQVNNNIMNLDNTNTDSPISMNSVEEQQAPGPVVQEQPPKQLFKDVIVNPKAKQRQSSSTTTTTSKSNINDKGYKYGLSSNYKKLHPQLGIELDEFLTYMIQPESFALSKNVTRQESPIRLATAQIYIRHAKLFLGWYDSYHEELQSQQAGEDEENVKHEDVLSIYTIIPNKEASSTQPIIDYILWLRNRNVSKSYEANILRGLTKLLKFRFLTESTADPSYGEKSFQDIPAVREMRKLHMETQRSAILSPRSSDESMKWISWDQYIGVIQAMKTDLIQELEQFQKGELDAPDQCVAGKYTSKHRIIAQKYQKYLVLAFFSCVPDRQRTIRELELGKTFLRQDECWVIKHGPDDYKTGKVYGDRPPMAISPNLTLSIDEFINVWRRVFQPKGNNVFSQIRTGNALTRDSVYSIVARSCFDHTGKKVNPHLLRDMIVTHVRDSNASEKELEALALYMGHSISMQRSSYDRRTMQQKVAPAVDLLQSVNNQYTNNNNLSS